MVVEVIGDVENIEIIAVGKSIREINRLRKFYGKGRWRKMKGKARVRVNADSIIMAEIHWYEAHGIGRKEMKIKRIF